MANDKTFNFGTKYNYALRGSGPQVVMTTDHRAGTKGFKDECMKVGIETGEWYHSYFNLDSKSAYLNWRTI